MTDARDYVLASLDPPSVWDFFPSIEAAAATQEEANTYNVKLEKHGAPKRIYEPMRYEDYQAKERDFYLSQPEKEISEKTFLEMLQVLPPDQWENKGDFESFLMCEHWSGPYTQQYVRRRRGDNATYWSKLVDSTDRKTWMQETRITSGPLTPDERELAFRKATTSMSGANERWAERVKTGLTDAKLAEALQYELCAMGGKYGPGEIGITYQGNGLKIWADRCGGDRHAKPILEGQATVSFARRIYGIDNPTDKQRSLF